MSEEQKMKSIADSLSHMSDEDLFVAMGLACAGPLRDPHKRGMEAATNVLKEMDNDERISKVDGGPIAALHGALAAIAAYAHQTAPSERLSRLLVESAVSHGLAANKEESKEEGGQEETYRAEWTQ